MTWRQIGGLLLLSAIWGGSFLFIKIGVGEIAPLTLVAARLVIAALVLLLVMQMQGLRLPRAYTTWRGLVLLGAVGLVIPFWLITWGEQFISSSLAAITLATNPLLSMMLTAFVMRAERLSPLRVLGLLIGFGGVIVAVGEGLQPDASLLGRLAVFGAAICYALTGLYARAAFPDTPPLVIATGQMITGGLLALPLALVIDPWPVRWPSATVLLALLGLSVICTSLAYILFYWLLARVGATRAALVTYLVPVFALGYGAVVLGEAFTLRIGLGLGLIVLGILITSDRLPVVLRSAGDQATGKA